MLYTGDIMILIFILYFLCALTFTLAKSTLAYAQPVFYVGIRMFIAGVGLISFYYCKNGLPHRIARKEWKLILQIMFFSIYCAYVLDLWSLQFLTSTESSLVFNLSPFIAALFSYIWFKETMTLKKWLGLMLGSFSLLPLIFLHQEAVLSFDAYRIIPLCALLISVTASAYGWILMRELIIDHDRSPILINGIAMLGGGIMALITSGLTERWTPSPVYEWPQFLLYTFLMIIVANVMFSNLYGYLLKSYTATFVSFAGFLCPIFTALLGSLFLNEPLNARFFFSLFGVFTGLILFYQEELRQGYSQNSLE